MLFQMWVRQAATGDEATLRDMRLQALGGEPEAFGSTYARELARTVEDWRRWLARGVTFFLEDHARNARGMVFGELETADVVHLMAMWVHPDARGSGGGDLLVEAVVSWAQTQGAKAVHLRVIDNNGRARRFYERNGFRFTGDTRLRERDGAVEMLMERLLAP